MLWGPEWVKNQVTFSDEVIPFDLCVYGLYSSKMGLNVSRQMHTRGYLACSVRNNRLGMWEFKWIGGGNSIFRDPLPTWLHISAAALAGTAKSRWLVTALVVMGILPWPTIALQAFISKLFSRAVVFGCVLTWVVQIAPAEGQTWSPQEKSEHQSPDTILHVE